MIRHRKSFILHVSHYTTLCNTVDYYYVTEHRKSKPTVQNYNPGCAQIQPSNELIKNNWHAKSLKAMLE